MALFRTLPTPTNDLLPRLMVEVYLVLAPDVTSSLIHASRGYLVSVVFSFFFSSSLLSFAQRLLLSFSLMALFGTCCL